MTGMGAVEGAASAVCAVMAVCAAAVCAARVVPKVVLTSQVVLGRCRVATVGNAVAGRLGGNPQIRRRSRCCLPMKW